MTNPTTLNAAHEDEKFHFIGGMGELLTAIATFILFIGLSILLFGLKSGGGISSFVYGNFAMLLGLTLVMSEYITRRKKLVGPSIVLSSVFAILSTMMVSYYDLDSSVQVNGFGVVDQFENYISYNKNSGFIPVVLALACHILYYLRYKTPFMLLLIGIGSAYAAFNTIVMGHSWLLDILYAVAVVALAVWYDQKDINRISRKSDCAFWLHLVGAIIFMRAVSEPLGLPNAPSANAAFIFLLIYFCLIVLAIIINRRALISTGLVFAAYSVYQLLENIGGFNVSITAITLISIGAIVLALSLWWQGIRAFVMRFMPESLNKSFPVGHGF